MSSSGFNFRAFQTYAISHHDSITARQSLLLRHPVTCVHTSTCLLVHAYSLALLNVRTPRRLFDAYAAQAEIVIGIQRTEAQLEKERLIFQSAFRDDRKVRGAVYRSMLSTSAAEYCVGSAVYPTCKHDTARGSMWYQSDVLM